ncbi:MAG: hypothetical protein ACYTXA_19760 [Nostoc sp.]
MPNTSLREAAPTTSLRDATRTLSTSAQFPILLVEKLRQRLLYETPLSTSQYKCPMPNAQVHTNILKEFGYLVRQFGIS